MLSLAMLRGLSFCFFFFSFLRRKAWPITWVKMKTITLASAILLFYQVKLLLLIYSCAQNEEVSGDFTWTFLPLLHSNVSQGASITALSLSICILIMHSWSERCPWGLRGINGSIIRGLKASIPYITCLPYICILTGGLQWQFGFPSTLSAQTLYLTGFEI